MKLIDHWSHSANTLVLVAILFAVLAALVSSGLTVVPTAILLCVGLIIILSRFSLASYLPAGEDDKPDKNDPLDALKDQYVQGKISEDELEHQLRSALEGEKVEGERRNRHPVREQE